MNLYIRILKKALTDPKLDEIGCIRLDNIAEVVRIFSKHSPDAVISEWRYGLGEVHYEYHIHNNGIAKKLKNAYEEGHRGGQPRLTAVYSKHDLENLILQS